MRQIVRGRKIYLFVLMVGICGCGVGNGGDGGGDTDSRDVVATDDTLRIDSGTSYSDTSDTGSSRDTTTVDVVDTGTDSGADIGSDSVTDSQSSGEEATDSTMSDSDSLQRDTDSQSSGEEATDSTDSTDSAMSDSDSMQRDTASETEFDSAVSCMPVQIPDDAEPLPDGAFQTKLDPANVKGYSPDVAISGCRVHAVWTSDQQLNYRRGDHLGAPMLTRVALARDEGIGFRQEAQVKVDNELVVVAWQQSGIHFRVSRDGGDSFGEAGFLENIKRDFTLTVNDNGHLLLMYIELDEGVMCSESQDFGDTWTSPTVVLPHKTDENWSSVSAVMAQNSESIHAALLWGSTMSIAQQIYYVSSEAGCTGWQTPDTISEKLSNDRESAAAGSVAPVIAIDGQYLDLIWSERIPDSLTGTRIYHRRSTDLGQTWNPMSTLETAVDTPTTILSAKDVAATGRHIRIASSRGYFESDDGGESWSDIDSSIHATAVATVPGGTVATTIAPIAQLYLISRP